LSIVERLLDPERPWVDQLVEYVKEVGGEVGVGAELPGLVFGIPSSMARRLLQESGRVEFSKCGRVVRVLRAGGDRVD
jgi:hypothetical protein